VTPASPPAHIQQAATQQAANAAKMAAIRRSLGLRG